MSAKKLMLAALITTMLSACGGSNTQAPLPAGDDLTTPPASSDDYGSGGDYSGGDDAYASDSSGVDDPTGTGTTVPAEGFVLKGIVVDKQTKAPIKGATVTIGSSTQLTGDDGTFEIKDIMDTQVWVNVSKDGFQAIKQENITFSEAKPTADKEFSLAASSGSSDSDDEDEDEDTARFKHLATLGEGKFKNVSAMAVDGDTVYVLGLVDKFLLDSVAVVAYDLASGNEIATFRNVGFLKNLPKTATSLKVEDGEVYVSNGEDAWVFSSSGTFLRKEDGARYNPIKEVEDDGKDRTYIVDGSKIQVKQSGPDPILDLDETGTIKAIALGPDHTLVVLDGSSSTVQTYEYED